MPVTLTTTWQPHGELNRLLRCFPLFSELYEELVIVMPPDVEPDIVVVLKELDDVQVVLTSDWSRGRHIALEMTLQSSAEFIHYVDMDRLIRWGETRPNELRTIVNHVAQCDCLIIGRTQQAYQTHPQALIQTEMLFNLFFSHTLGQWTDLASGSRGFARHVIEFLLLNSDDQHAFGDLAEWPILLHRAGFKIDYVEVDGLDWETADRYLDAAADSQRQNQLAAEYDADRQNWVRRVEIAQEVTVAGLNALTRKLHVVIDE